jgi:hypothetical protein
MTLQCRDKLNADYTGSYPECGCRAKAFWRSDLRGWLPVCGTHARGRRVVRIERTKDMMPDRRTRYWEAFSPEGFRFADGPRSYICESLEDAWDRVRQSSLEPCDEED